jgi:hypothetical protein
LLGALALVAIAAGTPAAIAADSALALSARVPADCPGRQALHDEVLRLARVGADAPRRLEAEVDVEKSGVATFSLALSTRLDGVSGERRFEGSTCQAVMEAAALTLALMLNPEVEPPRGVAADEGPPSLASAEVSRPAPARTLPDRSQPPRPRLSSPSESTTPSVELHGTLAALAGIQAGLLPKAGPELSAAIGVSTRRVGAFLTASYVPAQDARLSGQEAGGRLWAASANLLGCWSALAGAAGSVGPCAGGELSRVAGRGLDVDEPKDGAIIWGSVVAGVSGGLRLSPSFELRGTVLGLVPLARPEVFLDDIGQVHEPGRLTGRAQAGLAFELF